MMKYFLFTLILLMAGACSYEQTKQPFDLQGHRGARGLLPENTIPSFLIALDHGVDTIEMDLVVTKEGELLVSHEPWFHHHISTKPDGSPVTEEEAMDLNIYEMTYEEIKTFDVGSRGHHLYPQQEPIPVHKPLFIDAIRAIEAYVTENNLNPVAYNIETKSSPDLYGIMYPYPDEYARILADELAVLNREFDLTDRLIIQSFDPATLVELRKLEPGIAQAILVNRDEPMQSYLDSLGYIPEIWSPNFRLVTPEMVEQAHNLGMKVIPWTINTVDEMQNQLNMGVDGIITDYPDSAAVLR